MAPTVTAAVIYSKEHLTLDNKLRKPMVEKMCRDRINSSIEQLKSLLSQEFLSQHPDSKLEKADILEMTVSFLRRQGHHQPVSTSSCSAAENEGFFRCVQEIVHFLSREDVKTQSQMRLLRHFQTMQPSSGKSRSDSAHLAQVHQLVMRLLKRRQQSTAPSGDHGELQHTGAQTNKPEYVDL